MRYLLNGEFSYKSDNFIEKILKFYFELFTEEANGDYIRLIGIDSVICNLILISYFLQQYIVSFHIKQPCLQLPWKMLKKY